MIDFLNYYQNIPANLSPVLFQIGDFSLRWYSIGYLLAFLTSLGLVWWRIRKKEFDSRELPADKIKEVILDIFLVSIFGMMVGARLGYFAFYDWTTIFNNPLEIFIPGSQGFFGFSFHGGLIGSLLSAWIYCRHNKLSFEAISDLILPTIPLGFFWGRLGNFFNGELFGNETSKPWGMHFSADQAMLRHPSQLYEALGEGVIIFIVLWSIRNYKQVQGNFISLFLILYGSIRFIIEFFRSSPAEHMIIGVFTTGQILCLGMMAFGIYLFHQKDTRHKDTRNKQIKN